MSECSGPGCTHPEHGKPEIKPEQFPGLRQIVANAYAAQIAPPLTVEKLEATRDALLAEPLRSQYRDDH